MCLLRDGHVLRFYWEDFTIRVFHPDCFQATTPDWARYHLSVDIDIKSIQQSDILPFRGPPIFCIEEVGKDDLGELVLNAVEYNRSNDPQEGDINYKNGIQIEPSQNLEDFEIYYIKIQSRKYVRYLALGLSKLGVRKNSLFHFRSMNWIKRQACSGDIVTVPGEEVHFSTKTEALLAEKSLHQNLKWKSADISHNTVMAVYASESGFESRIYTKKRGKILEEEKVS
jgi:hypothetical protein